LESINIEVKQIHQDLMNKKKEMTAEVKMILKGSQELSSDLKMGKNGTLSDSIMMK